MYKDLAIANLACIVHKTVKLNSIFVSSDAHKPAMGNTTAKSFL